MRVEGIVAASQKNLPAMKMEVVGVWQPSAVATDVTAELAAIERAGADIVFTLLSGPVGILGRAPDGRAQDEGDRLRHQRRGAEGRVLAGDHGKGNYVSTLDTFAEVDDAEDHIVREGVQGALQQISAYNAGTYAVTPWKTAIEQAGTTNADKLVPVLEKISFTTLTGVLEFDKRHDLVWGPGKITGIAVQWQDGKKVPSGRRR